MAQETKQSGGIGFAELLTILLIGLKLTNYINWPWWWIFAPIWFPFLGALILAFIPFIISVLEKMYLSFNFWIQNRFKS